MLESFNFTPERFNRLFPFYILIDNNQNIISFGDSLAKIIGEKKNRLLYDVFNVKRPTLVNEGFEKLKEIANQTVILEYNDDKDFILRGQIELVSEGHERLLFIGTPWFGSMDEVVSRKLTLHDFAFHDPMIDLLHVLKTQEIATQEIKLLLTKVNQQKNILKESEQRTSTLIVNLNTGILLEDENRKIILANQMFCDMFKIQVQPYVLKGADCTSAAEQNKHFFKNPDQFVRRIEEVLAHKETVLADQLDMVDGRIFERDYVPIFISDVYKGHLWKYTDITEQKNYERNLKKQEEKYRSIIANMNLGLVEVNLDYEIQYFNQGFCDISGYSPSELIDKKIAQFLVKGKNENDIDSLPEDQHSGTQNIHQLPVRNKNGELRWWLLSDALNYNDQGEQIGYIGIYLDITEQKKLEDELIVAKFKAEESAKAKESFLANMSHEIRTPLNAIIGMIRELSKEFVSHKQSTNLKHARSASQHLLSIVNNILDFSKIEAGELHLEKHTFALREVFDETDAIMSPAAKDKMLELTFDMSPEIAPAFIGDSNRMRQILINIISNSIKFTEKGKVSVRCSALARNKLTQKICIEIADTGIGMKSSFLKNLFKKFTQEDLSTGRKYGGTGLGMAITYELIQLMKGTVDVKSEKGEGTQFQIVLDFEIGDENEIERATSIERLDKIRNRKILLVEDNELNRLVVSNTLSFYDVDITEAVDGSHAINILKKSNFDLILMDLQMPVMDGITATKIIRSDLKIKTPIIALTANAFKNEIERCMSSGMTDYVTKPFEEKTLLSVINKNITILPNAAIPDIPDIQQDLNELPNKRYSLQKLKQVSLGNLSFAKKLVNVFIEKTPASIQLIKDAFEQKDYETINRISHKIKPSIDNLGISSLKDDILALEAISETNSTPSEIEQKINKLEDVISQVIAALANEQWES